MTNKQMVAKIRRFLLKQGKQAYQEGCMYLTEDGLKCAVGCLLKKKAYTPELEGNTIGDNIVLQALRDSGLSPLTKKRKDILSQCQIIHDDYYKHHGEWEDYINEEFDKIEL